MKKVLVTGGCGFIGGHVVEALLEKEYGVVVVDNRRTGCLIMEHPNVKYEHRGVVEVTIEEDIDHIIHLAAWSIVRESMEHPFRLYADNVLTTASIMDDILQGGLKVKSLVFASSSAVESPESHYGVSKLISEQMLGIFEEQTGIPCARLRFANVYGPRQSNIHGTLISNLVECILCGNSPVVYGDGMQGRDYIYVKDVVAAIILSMEQQLSGALNVSTGITTSVKGVIEATSEAAGLLGLSCPIAVYEAARAGDKANVFMGLSPMLRALNWQARIPLRTGIREQIHWAKAMEGTWKDNHRPDGSVPK